MRILLLLLIVLLYGCQQESAVSYQRAHDPWVFRSVLDGRPRMLTIALNNELWVAYSAQNGALYKAWRGSVNFDGAVYTTVHGPQPSSLGDSWLINVFDQPWTVLYKGKEEKPQSDYKGHRFEQGQVYVNYELLLNDGTRIKVSERPEFVTSQEGGRAFEREFKVEGLPEGARLRMAVNFSSVAFESNIKTDGQLTFTKRKRRAAKQLSGLDLEGTLTLQPEGPTVLTAYFTRLPLVENPNKVAGAEEEETRPLGYRLIQRNDCKSCHNTYVQTVGPAYMDIAKRYRNTEANTEMLALKIKNGGSGAWGEAVMSGHPETPETDIKAMVDYIMELDVEEEALLEEESTADVAVEALTAVEGLEVSELLPGALLKIYQFRRPLNSLADVTPTGPALYEGIMPKVYVEPGEFKGLESNFALIYTGMLNIPKTNNYVFRLRSDDGSRLLIDDKVIVDHDGLHGAEPKDGEIALEQGLHPFQVEYFQAAGGKFVSLEWKSFDDKAFTVVPPTAIAHLRSIQPREGARTPPMAAAVRIPGDRYALTEVHPSFDLSQARPANFLPKVGGMDFRSDGRLVVSTWDAEGGVYLLEGVQSGDPEQISVKKIATGLAEPLGLKVVEDTIYVLQKQELTKLIDHDGDEIIDEYYALCNDWRVSGNFHEFAFGLAYQDGFFYGSLAIAILPGGASANPQIPDRGKAVRIARKDGSLEFIAEGLRTPNGIAFGIDKELFIADNQGDWLPSSKILHVTPGDFFGSRAVDPARVADKPVKLPVVWLPQDEIGNSPSTPLAINEGPYKGQMIHGEVTHGGVKRVFAEKVDGQYQGAVFRFIQGLEAGVNRMVWGPDSALYIGGVGSSGNWRHEGGLWYGLQRLKYNEKPTFEMLSVSARTNGLEIAFTEPLPEGIGWNTGDYTVQQWYYQPTSAYGGPKLGQQDLPVRSASVSNDRQRVFIELQGMKENHLIYLRLPYEWTSAAGRELWSTEAWYTLNRIPAGKPGEIREPAHPVLPNTLTAEEQKAGWKLLFDGKTTDGWRNYGQKTIDPLWRAVDGTLTLATPRDENGNWIAEGGGDIITEEEFQDFELKLEWKISPCGNSGLFFNVQESEEFTEPWNTGPEMQILDNACHPDARFETHRAGCLYDMIPVKYETVYPAGEWNKVRLISRNGHVEQWLNGRKVVQYDILTNDWREMIANSKFKEYPGFGKFSKGHIALQDHNDAVVSFRNIKIRER